MRAREIISEKLVPSKWVPVKATPAIVPTSQLDKALPVYNPQGPAPMPLTGDVMGGVAQSLGQIAQMDAAQIGIEQQELQKLNTIAPPPQQLAQGGQPPVAEAQVKEKFMPASSFAGTGAPFYHKLGSQAQAKGKQKGPVRKGQLVGGAAESRVNEDDNTPPTVNNPNASTDQNNSDKSQSSNPVNAITDYVAGITKQAVDTAKDDPEARTWAGWLANNAISQAPSIITDYYPGLRQGATWAELGFAAGMDGWQLYNVAKMAAAAYAAGTGVLAPLGAWLAGEAGAEEALALAARKAGLAAMPEMIRQVRNTAIGQGAKKVITPGLEKGVEQSVGLPPGTIDTGVKMAQKSKAAGSKPSGGSSSGGSFLSNLTQPTQPQQQQDTSPQKTQKKKFQKGEKIPVPIDGKTYMLPVVDVSDNSYTVDTSSVTGSSSGSKTMIVPA